MLIIFFKLLLALILPTASGWMLLRLIEGSAPVLRRYERVVLGFVFGLTGTMYITFLVHIAGLIRFTFIGFLSVQLILTALLGVLIVLRRSMLTASTPDVTPSPKMSTVMKVVVGLLGTWLVLKILAGFALLTLTPTYQDDVFNNWNMRGKAFFVHQELMLEIPFGNEQISSGGVHSYPPTVSMIKTWLAHVEGEWNEPIVNSIHIFWYISAIILLYFALRRYLSRIWSLIGVYILGSLPLFLMHGSVPYADAFLAVHVFAAVSMIYHAFMADDDRQRSTCFKIGALAAGLLIFTKNESLVLHLPALLLILAIGLWTLSRKDLKKAVLWYAVCILLIALPWVAFKWMHGLNFGNAKSLTGQTLAWQPLVPISVWVNTFFEGNWLLLFPLLLGLLIVRWRVAFRNKLVILTGFFLIIYLTQLFLFLFTGLSTEATRQTGYARGLIQLMPVIVMVTTMLLADLLRKKDAPTPLAQEPQDS